MNTDILRRIFFVLLILGTWKSTVTAQEQYMFKRLETRDGLSHSQVNDIFKDSRGFMWFATAGGLNRYDGYDFKVLRYNEEDPFSLSDNFVDGIQEDAAGNLWIHTASGYLMYDVQKEAFRSDMDEVLKEYGLSGTISHLYIDKKKNLWFYMTDEGMFYYSPESKELKPCLYHSGEKLKNGAVTDISEDGNRILILYSNGTVETFDWVSGYITGTFDYISRHSGVISGKYSIFVDSDGDWWIYPKDNTGVWHWKIKNDTWYYMNTTRQETHSIRLTSNVVQSIAEDNHKKIWLATDHGGIDIIDKNTQTVTNLQHRVTDERSLSQNSINSVYRDDMDIMWVGTYKKGVSYYSESLFKFEVNHLTAFSRQMNFENDITIVETDLADNLWIGTNGSGLIHTNRQTGAMKLFEHQPGSLTSDVIVSLCQARDGKLWIGTYLGGLDCYDGKQFIHYRHDPDNPNSLASPNVWSLVEDEDGYIWIGTLGGGLQCLNPATGKFTTYRGTQYLSSDFVSSLYASRSEKLLFIGTAVGVTILDKSTGTFTQFQGNRAGTQQLSNQNVQQVYLDTRNLLWIATRDGLNVYDRKTDSLHIIRRGQGLADDFVCAIAEDSDRNMWVTTANGLTNIVVSANPRTSEYTYLCYNYDELDGLQGREFNIRSITRTQSGEIVMGGINGFNIFNPANIRYNESLPRVVFTDFQLFNQEVQVDSVYNGNRILSRALPLTDRIELEYRQNVFSVGFSGMDYILPEKARYLYKLDGFNTDWLSVEGYAHRVTYTNLSPGTYVLKVMAANSDGYWNEVPGELTIVIRPPFWLSTWAYIIYFFLAMGILWMVRYIILRNERSKFRMQQVELEAQRKHELDDMKLRFFTNVSHELRTPLTLIISPLENLMRTMENSEYRDKLTLIHRNATRLLNIVNQLLDFRKSDVQGHKLNVSTGDIIPVLRNAGQSFAALSDKKNIRLTFSSSEEAVMMDFDEDKINKIMMNLLSNAFKFTPDGGSVDISVQAGSTLQVRVTDTGQGVLNEDKQRIFERFYQSQDSTHHVSGGSGIGLHLVKEFVELHGGTIHVEDNPGGGSIFILCIPIHITSPHAAAMVTLPEVTVIQEPEETASAAVALPDGETTDSRPLILIVDDNDDFRSFMKSTLESEYNIHEAADGLAAWEMIPELQPDFIISDVMMPVMDGIELTRRVKNDVRTSHIPLILLTARTAEEHKIEGLETGADDYLTKPFNIEILSLRIRKLLELRSSKQEKFRSQIDPVPSEITITSLDEKLISKAIKYVEENMSRSELSVEELSRELGMSRVHLYKKLTAITGRSPVEFIRTIRLKRAAQFLRQSQMNVSEIAYEVGFNNPKYFSRYFKEEFGMLPSEYKAKTENND